MRSCDLLWISLSSHLNGLVSPKGLCFNSWFMRTVLSDHHAVERLLPEGLEERLEAVFWLSSPYLCPPAVWSWPMHVFSLPICSWFSSVFSPPFSFLASVLSCVFFSVSYHFALSSESFQNLLSLSLRNISISLFCVLFAPLSLIAGER